MFQKTSTANNNTMGQTVDLAATKLNDLYGSGGNVLRPDGHVHNSSSGSTAVNNGVPSNGVYGNNGGLISGQGHRAPGVDRVQSNSLRGLHNGGGGTWTGAFGTSNNGSTTMAVAHQQAPLAGLRCLRVQPRTWLARTGGIPNGFSMAQLVRLNGMNPFGVNMNTLSMANMSAMGITPEAQLLATQIAAAGGGFEEPGLGVSAGHGSFGGLKGGIGWSARRLREDRRTLAWPEWCWRCKDVRVLVSSKADRVPLQERGRGGEGEERQDKTK
ncbi:hypothetical protein BJY52DRAFT_1357770 [Lactarius psammicola]|nr:hypothetical protein BJY52DRAFT_1357770 [Lactarius psammicola]